MDMRLSARPQTLTLFSSCKPISSSPSLSPSKFRSIRKEFLGCGQNLTSPGTIRSRRRHRNSGLHSHSSRFIFKASLSSNSVLIVVGLVTLSAVSVVYYLSRLKSKKIAVETSGHSNFELPELDRDVMNINHAVPNMNVNVENLMKSDVEESIHSSDKEEAELQLHAPAMLSEKALVTEKLPSPLPIGVSSGLGNSDFHNETKVVDKLLLPGLSESEMRQSLQSSNKLNGLCTKEFLDKTESNYELHEVRSDSELCTSALLVNNLVPVENERTAQNELDKEAETTSYDVFLSESAREELYMFYEAKKYTTYLNGHNHLSRNASVLDSYAFSSSLRNTILKGAEVSTWYSTQAIEHHEGKLPFVASKEDHHHDRKYFGEWNGHPMERNARHLPQNNNHTLPHVPHLNGLCIGDDDHASVQFSIYNRLLKAGRLVDSMKLLEDLERRDLLDMNKVYHAKFFRSCKSQKAVKEAFRYIKLIPNPTLSTFNMLMSVCASSQDSEGAFQVLQLVHEAGLKVDCKLYTTLISTCAKSGKVDAMFEVYHKMVNAGVEPNVHTYGALIDGCARAAQVAKAFGAYGIMSSKKVKPDRVVFNALITACGQSGAVDRAFDVLAEMTTETQPIDPDHVTIGALIKACANAGQVDRAREVYKMMHKYKIKGTPEVYTIAVNCCSQTRDWEFACSVYDDMTDKGVIPDEMFLSALIDVAGHAGKLDAAFDILHEARKRGVPVGIVSYSSLMGACSNAGNWQKALKLYEDLKSNKVGQTVPAVNALITALCNGNQLQKAMEVLSEMKTIGLVPNSITYSVLLAASEKEHDLEVGLMLLSQAKKDGVSPNLVMCRCFVGMCLQGYQKACTLGESVLSFSSGRPQVDNKWTLSALMVYRETVAAGVMPTSDILSQVLGCLQLPYDGSLKSRLIENQGISADKSRPSNLCSLLDGFGEYDPRAFSLLQEAASLGTIQCVSFKENLVIVDVRKLEMHTAEVCLLTVLKGLKHRLAAGAKLPGMTILLPADRTEIMSSNELKTVNLAGRVGQAVAALLRRLGLSYQGNESSGKIRINGLTMKRWFQPKLASSLSRKPGNLSLSRLRLGKEITHQQRNIRTSNLSLD